MLVVSEWTAELTSCICHPPLWQRGDPKWISHAITSTGSITLQINVNLLIKQLAVTLVLTGSVIPVSCDIGARAVFLGLVQVWNVK